VTEIHKQPDVLKRIQSNMCKYVLKILDFNCKNILTCGPFFQELNNIFIIINVYLVVVYFLFALMAILLIIVVCPVLTVRAWPLIIYWYT
jgi:hypothetical protein